MYVFMIEQKTVETPVQGKTYSLYGDSPGTDRYYRSVREVADLCVQQCPDVRELLSRLQQASKKKRFLKKQLRTHGGGSFMHFVVTAARDVLSRHTGAVASHLKELSILKRWDGTLLTTEEQYHLYMLEIELANRIFSESFRQSKRKIAFLPYCLRDFSRDCRSARGELDYVCKGCSRECFINQVSALLRKYGAEPYIWMNAHLKSLLSELREKEDGLGVLGIACIPELVRGMRLCMRLDIPAVGIPLNANRCMRWTGEFHPTSVNLEELEDLVRPSWFPHRGQSSSSPAR